MGLQLEDDIGVFQDSLPEPVFRRTLSLEGGLGREKNGNLVNHGITQTLLDNYNRQRKLPAESVKDLNPPKVYSIFNEEFFKRPGYNKLSGNVGSLLFDFGVQSSPARASRSLQKVVGVEQDGIVGPRTLNAARDFIQKNGEKALLQNLIDDRVNFLKTTPAYKENPQGHINRINRIKHEFDLNLLNPFSVKDASADEMKLEDDAGVFTTGPGRLIDDAGILGTFEPEKPPSWIAQGIKDTGKDIIGKIKSIFNAPAPAVTAGAPPDSPHANPSLAGFGDTGLAKDVIEGIKSFTALPKEGSTYTSGTGFTQKEFTPEDVQSTNKTLAAFALGVVKIPLGRTDVYTDEDIKKIMEEHPVAARLGETATDLAVLKGISTAYKGMAALPIVSKIADAIARSQVVSKLSKAGPVGKRLLNKYEIERYVGKAIHSGATFGTLEAIKEAGIAQPDQTVLSSAQAIAMNAVWGSGLGLVTGGASHLSRVIGSGTYGGLTTALNGGTPADIAFNTVLFAGFEVLGGREVDRSIKIQAMRNIDKETYNYLVKAGIEPQKAAEMSLRARDNAIKQAGGLDKVLEQNSAPYMNAVASNIEKINPSWRFTAPKMLPNGVSMDEAVMSGGKPPEIAPIAPPEGVSRETSISPKEQPIVRPTKDLLGKPGKEGAVDKVLKSLFPGSNIKKGIVYENGESKSIDFPGGGGMEYQVTSDEIIIRGIGNEGSKAGEATKAVRGLIDLARGENKTIRVTGISNHSYWNYLGFDIKNYEGTISSIPIPEFKSTEEAVKFGQENTGNAGVVAQLQQKRDESLAKSAEVRKIPEPTDEQMQSGMDEAVKGQFYREALQAAKETPFAEEARAKLPTANKQPWEMTKEEYLNKRINDLVSGGMIKEDAMEFSSKDILKEHRKFVNNQVGQNVLHGKSPVSPRVLADYPDLQPSSVQPAPEIVEPGAIPQGIVEGDAALIEEAKKYKTAEEFVNKKAKWYHGSPSGQINKFNPTQEKGTVKGIAFSPDFEFSKMYGMGKKENVTAVYLNIKNTMPIDKFQEIVDQGYRKDFHKIIKQMGYDSVQVGEETQAIIVLNPKNIITKQHLTAIWNQAQGKQPAALSFEEFKQNEIKRLGSKHPAVTNELQLRKRYDKLSLAAQPGAIGKPSDEFGAIHGPTIGKIGVQKLREVEVNQELPSNDPTIKLQISTRKNKIWLTAEKKTKAIVKPVAVAYLYVNPDGTTILNGSFVLKNHPEPELADLAKNKLIDFINSFTAPDVEMPFSETDKSDIRNLIDWESGQQAGGMVVSGGKAGGPERVVTKTTSGHSKTMQEIGTKKSFELLNKALNDERLTPGELVKVHLLKDDFNANIKLQSEAVQKEIDNAGLKIPDGSRREELRQAAEKEKEIEYDWDGNVVPSEPAKTPAPQELQTLKDQVRALDTSDLEKLIETRYEANADQAELDLWEDIYAERVSEENPGFSEEFENEETNAGGWASLEEQLINDYHFYLQPEGAKGAFTTGGDVIGNMRAALENEGGNPEKIKNSSDEEILAAAKELYDLKVALLKRQRTFPKEFSAVPEVQRTEIKTFKDADEAVKYISGIEASGGKVIEIVPAKDGTGVEVKVSLPASARGKKENVKEKGTSYGKQTLFHGTRANVGGGVIKVNNPTDQWSVSQDIKNKVQPSISFSDTLKQARTYEGKVLRIARALNPLSLIDEELSPDALEYQKINNAELKGFDHPDWATSKKAYGFLKNKGYDSLVVWDAEGEGGPVEIRTFENEKISEGNILREETKYLSAPEGTPASQVPAPVSGLRESPISVEFKKTGQVIFPKGKIQSPQDVAFAFRSLTNEAQENFFIVALRNGRLVGVEHITTGSHNFTAPAIYEFFSLLNKRAADTVFFVHNHPSGEIAPSIEDIQFTKKAQDILGSVRIKLGGHVIIDTEKFGFINPDGTVESFTHKEYAQTRKVNVLKKYFEWSQSKDEFGPVIKASEDIYELVKGVQTADDAAIIVVMNSQNKVLGIYAVPDSALTSGKIVSIVTGARGSSVIIAGRHVRIHAHVNLGDVLYSAGINLLDSVRIQPGDNFKPYISALGEKQAEYGAGGEKYRKQIEDILAKQNKESRVTAAGNIRPELLPPDLKELFQEEGELFKGLKSEGGTLDIKLVPGAVEVSDLLSKSHSELKKEFNPTAVSAPGKYAAQTLRENLGVLARSHDQLEMALIEARRLFDKTSKESNLDFIYKMEEGGAQGSPALSKIAGVLRDILDSRRTEIQNLGTGKLQNFIENYFPHIWEDPAKARDVIINFLRRRPFQGPKSFLKKRSIPDTRSGIERGLVPVSYNPIDLVMLKVREMDRYLMANRTLAALKEEGIVEFVRIGAKPQEDWVKIKDPISDVYKSPEIPVSEYVDEGKYNTLSSIADKLGISHERVISGMRMLGKAYKDKNLVKTKFATDLGVLTHEIGHQLDWKFGLADQFVKDKELKVELRALSDLRYAGKEVSNYYKKYVRKGVEKMANMVDAYVNAPELFKKTAPKTFAKFKQFIDAHPVLAPLKNLESNLQRTKMTQTVNAGGLVIAGHLYAQPDAARIINNYLVPGLRGNYFYDLYRGAGNTLNQFQLGMSAFHLGFTSMDATVSKFALGLNKLSYGNLTGALKEFALTPFAPVTNFMQGRNLLQAWYGKDRGDLINQIAGLMASGGGRAKMDKFYATQASENFKKALQEGKLLTSVFRVPFWIVEQTARPILEYIVPRQKMGVFMDMMRMEIEKNQNLSHEELRDIAQKAWDSVDNRMGQLVYDNLFWNRVTKDMAMASVRSLGWNLGTFRELGGGVKDITTAFNDLRQGKPGRFSYRMAYLLALPIIAGIYGAIYQYLHTGKGPEELKDYYFPKTGGIDKKGEEARVSLPTYMKDIYHYATNPVQTVLNKFSPVNSAILQMLSNKDYYGTEIRNADDPVVQQALDELNFMASQFVPFGIRNLGRDTRKTIGSKIEPFIGITPAPYDVNMTRAERRAHEISKSHIPMGARTRGQAEHAIARADVRNAFFVSGDTAPLEEAVSNGIITRREKVEIIKQGKMSNLERLTRHLTFDEVLNVAKYATPAEREELKKIAATKERNKKRAGTWVQKNGYEEFFNK